MSSGEESGRPPDEAAEDQSTNEVGFRDVDEEGDYDESGGGQGSSSGGSGSGSGGSGSGSGGSGSGGSGSDGDA